MKDKDKSSQFGNFVTEYLNVIIIVLGTQCFISKIKKSTGVNVEPWIVQRVKNLSENWVGFELQVSQK